jgi:hypothetical protein
MGPLLRVSRFAQHLTHGFGRMSQKQRCFKELIGEYQMPLITVVLTICVVGILLWLINRFIPMQGQIKGILNAVVVIVLVVWLINVFGLLHYLTQFRVG